MVSGRQLRPPPNRGGKGGLTHSSGGLKLTLGAGRGKGMGKPRLPRQRITNMTGEVLEWTAASASGFLRGHEEVTHPRAQEHGGKIWVGVNDLTGISKLNVGQFVQFHV